MRIPACALALATALAALPLRAEEVTIQHNGLTLNADLNLAEGKTVMDGVILMTHAALQHNRMEIVRVVTRLFRENSFSTLAMTYSAGLDNRRGPYDCAVPHRHSVEGYWDEIGLWMDWLKERGAETVVLAGHSGGGSWMAQYVNENDDPAIARMLLFAPGTADHYARSPEGYRARYRKELSEILDRAKTLVGAGKGDTMMEDIDFLFCPRTTVSANAFLSYYDPSRLNNRLIPRLMEGLRKPTLVIGASEDNIAPDMARMVEPFADGKRLRLTVLEGCGHFFRDLCADDAVEAAVEFLRE